MAVCAADCLNGRNGRLGGHSFTQTRGWGRREEDYISLTDMLKSKDGDFLFPTGLEIVMPLNIWAFGSECITPILITANSP